MKFFLLIIFLIFPSIVFGEWSMVSGNSSHGVHIYVDFKKIIKKNNSTYFWYLMDFKEKKYIKGIEYFHSFVIRSQGDCDLFRFKRLEFNVYKSRMGKNLIRSFKPKGEWKYPIPGSNFDGMLESVCKKQKF